MEKIMPLELLSSIKGARSSEAVNELFKVIQQAVPDMEGDRGSEEDSDVAISVERLRSDTVKRSSELEREIIRKNFPNEKNGFLVVSKVIED